MKKKKKALKKSTAVKIQKLALSLLIVLLLGVLASVVTFAVRPDLFEKDAPGDNVVQTPPVDDKPNEPVVEESKYKYTELGFNNYADTLYLNATEEQFAALGYNNGFGSRMQFAAIILVEDKYPMGLYGAYNFNYGMASNVLYLTPFGENTDHYPEYLKANIFWMYDVKSSESYDEYYTTNKNAIAQEFTDDNGLPTYLPDSLGLNANAFGEDMELISPVNGQKISGTSVSMGQFYFICQPNLFSKTPVMSKEDAMKIDYMKHPIDFKSFDVYKEIAQFVYFDTTRPLEEQMDLTTNRCVLDTSRSIALYVQDGILYAGPSALYQKSMLNALDSKTEEEYRALYEDLALNCCKVIYSVNDTSIQFYGKTVYITKGWQNLNDYGCFDFATIESQSISDIDGEECMFFWVEDEFNKIVSSTPISFDTAENVNTGTTDYNLTYTTLTDGMMVYALRSKDYDLNALLNNGIDYTVGAQTTSAYVDGVTWQVYYHQLFNERIEDGNYLYLVYATNEAGDRLIRISITTSVSVDDVQYGNVYGQASTSSLFENINLNCEFSAFKTLNFSDFIKNNSIPLADMFEAYVG